MHSFSCQQQQAPHPVGQILGSSYHSLSKQKAADERVRASVLWNTESCFSSQCEHTWVPFSFVPISVPAFSWACVCTSGNMQYILQYLVSNHLLLLIMDLKNNHLSFQSYVMDSALSCCKILCARFVCFCWVPRGIEVLEIFWYCADTIMAVNKLTIS